METSLSLSDIGKDPITFSTGELAKQANGSVSVSCGDTVVLATACMSKEPKEPKEGIGFLPLFVDYQERTYAVGKIPGGFFKREGRPKDIEILTSRLIDRPIRPLFPEGLTHELQVIAMVLSSDGKNDPDVIAINGVSCALTISDIPFNGPIGAVRVALAQDEFIINPTYEERQSSDLDLVVVGRDDSVLMLEGKFSQIDEKIIIDAIKFAHPFIKKIISLQKKLADKVGKKKVSVKVAENNSQLEKVIREKMEPKVKDLYGKGNKEEKSETAKKLISSIHEELLGDNPELTVNEVKNVFFLLEEEVMRTNILEKDMRPDGRGLKEIRPIDCKVRVLPRTHGSAIFTRGQTQALAVITLGTSSDEQLIEALEGKQYKNFMMHYAFPPFSVGEIKPLRGPSRRDVGHGALAEKALSSILPTKEEFPYTIRVVSEILESNGSSSMATVCAASLSLMDTGVPIKAAIAGIALGLVKGKDKYKVLTDIAGIEDHYGDMDLKIAGTKKGVSAIQMDIKIDGLSFEILEQAFDQAKEGRHFILEKMAKALEAPMPALSKYAPKIKSFKIDQDKIGTVIGPGGRMIRRLTRDYNVSIDIDDETNTVSVVAQTEDDLERAIMQISNLVRDIEVGDVYEGKVERLVNFGAFCEIVPGKSGLVRISEVSDTFVKDVNDVLKEGDIVKVKVIGIDPQGRINLSIKQA